MENCLFCRIARGQISSMKIYEDGNCFAFLDINPCTPGHTVVIPKVHYQAIDEIPEEEAALLWAGVNKLAIKIQAALKADGVNIGINNGKVAGQEVPHVHIHIIPRYKGDGGGAIQSIVQIDGVVNTPEIAEKIRKSL